jgi:hypothetical protein
MEKWARSHMGIIILETQSTTNMPDLLIMSEVISVWNLGGNM